jgi:hypothetical protein
MKVTANHFSHALRPWSYGWPSHFWHGTSETPDHIFEIFWDLQMYTFEFLEKTATQTYENII